MLKQRQPLTSVIFLFCPVNVYILERAVCLLLPVCHHVKSYNDMLFLLQESRYVLNMLKKICAYIGIINRPKYWHLRTQMP